MIRNIVSNGATFVISAVVGFLFTPFLIHSLGNTSYGLWVLLVSLTGYLGLLDLGTRSTYPKFISQYRATGDTDGLRRFLSTVMVVCVLLGLVTLVIATVGGVLAQGRIPTDPQHRGNVPLLIALLGLNLGLAFPFSVFQGILYGCHRFVVVNVVSVIGTLVRTGLLYVALTRGHGLMALALITLLSSVATSIVYIVLAFRALPGVRFRLADFDRNELRSISRFSMSSFVINISDYIIYSGSSVIVGFSMGTASVAVFNVAETLVAYMRQAVLSLVVVLVPVASEMFAKHEIDRLQRLVITSTRLVLLLVLPLGIMSVLAGRTFIHLWLGPGFEMTATCLAILGVAQALALSQYGPESILYGINRHRRLSVLMITISVTVLILCVILVRSGGLIGVALGCAAPLVLGQTIFVPRFLKSFVQLPIGRYLRQSALPAFTAAGVFALALWLLMRLIHPTTWLSFILVVAGAVLLYLPAVYWIGLNREERGRFLPLRAPGTATPEPGNP